MTSSERVATPFGAKATADEVLDGVDLDGKTFVVTGGASGIGRETTAALARRGAQVVVGVRNPDAATAAFASMDEPVRRNIVVRPLDLSMPSSVDRFVGEWAGGHDGPGGPGGLDGLVANAGIMALPTRQLDSHGWELQLATNYLGHFALARGLHPALAEVGGRVVALSSTAHLRAAVDFDDPHYADRPYDRWNAYSQSKTADVLLAAGIASRWEKDGIAANALMPGWITTNLQRHLDDDTLRSMGAMDDDGNRIEQAFFKTPARGAATSVLLAASPLVAGVTGRYFEDNQEAEVVETGDGHSTGVARHALDPANADRLWEMADRALG